MHIPEKKSEILKAARECFARFGYEKTTLDDIGKMVGLNKASLYYYYKNKEAIFADVILHEIGEATQMLSTKIEAMPGCRDKLLTYVRERLRYMQNLINVHNLSMSMIRQVQPVLTHLFQDIKAKEIALINSILLDCIEHGEIKPCDTKRIAHTILTVMDAIKAAAFQGTDARFVEKVDMTAVEEDVVFTVSLILDGLQQATSR